MATLSKEEIEAIVERDVPGHRLVRGAADERADDSERFGGNLDSRESGPDSDAASPNLDTLREKLRRKRSGDTRSGSQVDARASRESDDADDDEEYYCGRQAEGFSRPVRRGASHQGRGDFRQIEKGHRPSGVTPGRFSSTCRFRPEAKRIESATGSQQEPVALCFSGASLKSRETLLISVLRLLTAVC